MIHARPSSQPDLLAGATLSSLTRPIYFPLSWGVLPSFLGTVFTLGILPAILIPRWARSVIAQHQQQARHLAEWLWLHTGSQMTIELRSAANEIRYRPVNVWLARGCLIIALTALTYHFTRVPLNLQTLFEFLFYGPRSIEKLVFNGAIGGGTVAYIIDFALRQQRDLSRYIKAFNRVSIEQELPEISPQTTPFAIGWIWWIAVLAIFFIGAAWGVPALLAMGIHRRYTMVTSVRLRAQLAERMRALLDRETPPLTIPRHPVTILRACIRPNCRAPLSYAAAFCPRCGTTIARSVDVVG